MFGPGIGRLGAANGRVTPTSRVAMILLSAPPVMEANWN
jgi:hypothetical protein